MSFNNTWLYMALAEPQEHHKWLRNMRSLKGLKGYQWQRLYPIDPWGINIKSPKWFQSTQRSEKYLVPP